MIESAAIMPRACLAIHDERVLALNLEKLLANGLDATSRHSHPPRGCSDPWLLRKSSIVIKCDQRHQSCGLWRATKATCTTSRQPQRLLLLIVHGPKRNDKVKLGDKEPPRRP